MFTVLVAASSDARSTFQSTEDRSVIVFRIKRSTARVRGAIESVCGRATHTGRAKGAPRRRDIRGGEGVLKAVEVSAGGTV